MNRPYIFCHMLTSIDGKIMGAYMESPEGRIAGDVFNEISFGKNSDYAPQALLCGRITTDDNFTCYHKPELDDNAPTVPAGDYIVKKEMPYYVAVDTSGKLGWESDRIEYSGVSLSVLEVLTEKTSNSYKAFLRRLNIPYIIAGENELDHKLVMEKLNTSYKDKRAKKTPKDEIVIFKNTQEPIVDEETWNMAQELRKTVRRPDILGEANPLTGKMFCADCGAKMYNHRHRTARYRKDIYTKGKGRWIAPEDDYNCSKAITSSELLFFHAPMICFSF